MIKRSIHAPDPCPEWLSLAELAQFCGVSPSTARTWVERGNLAARREPGSSGRYLVYGPSFVDWIEREHPITLSFPRKDKARWPARDRVSTAAPFLGQEGDDAYAAELRIIGGMFARWHEPYPVAWPAWVGPFPALEAS